METQKKQGLFIEKIQQLEEFHRIFKLPYSKEICTVEDELAKLRHNLMAEENDEYLEACMKHDLTGIADALGDQLYVLLGTVISHGMQHIIEDVFNEIHLSNMSKLDENRQPIFREDGKILKSSHFFRPDIKSIIERNR